MLQKNKRRYGGYVVHFGMVVMFVGFTGKAFDTEKEQHLQIGESMQVRGYTLEYMDFQILDDANKTVYKAKMDVYKNGKKIKTFYPNKHFYKVQEQPTTEVVLRSTLLEDLYVVLAQPNEDRSAVFKVYINPLVNLVWLSGLIITLGTFIILLPDAREKRMVPARVRTRRKAEVV